MSFFTLNFLSARRAGVALRRIFGPMTMTMSLLLGGAGACGTPWRLIEMPGQPEQPVPPTDTLDPGAPVTSAAALPSMSGGTLHVTSDDGTAVASDPDRNALWLVDLNSKTVRARIDCGAGSDPGRIVEDQDGKVHVALRRGGEVMKVDPKTGSVESRRAVCKTPRGLAYDSATDDLHVVCAEGELVTLKARGGDVVRTVRIDDDLRDVVVRGSSLLISRFRSAEILSVDSEGKVQARAKPRVMSGQGVDASGMRTTASPTTAWRMVGLPSGAVAVLHQRALDSQISVKNGGYGMGPCTGSGISTPGLTLFQSTGGGVQVGNGMTAVFLPVAVDLAARRDGTMISLIGPNGGISPSSGMQLNPATQTTPNDACVPPSPVPSMPQNPDDQAVAGCYDGRGTLWVQYRNPPRITSLSASIPLSQAEDRSDAGYSLFHNPTKGLIACMSCHPEGGDDGHVWDFEGIGKRRSQSLRGGILGTAPFHWDGDMNNMNTLMTQVFGGRMAGAPPSPGQSDAVGKWLDSQPLVPKSAPSDPNAVERGRALFEDPEVGCAACHSGKRFTNNASADVGTGKTFQVPSLNGLSHRAPYMHSGCAATLRDRFTPGCGGGDKHGKTSQLSAGQIDDLVAYLASL